MTTNIIGCTFTSDSQWHADEKQLINLIAGQIDNHFPIGRNLLINLTWFGPQFQHSAYYELDKYQNVDRIFFLASVDASMITREQQQQICDQLGAKEQYFLGNFDSAHQFSFIATLLPKYFQSYTQQELCLTDLRWIYLNYNRKPRQHRVDLVRTLIKHGLENYGLISLGAPDPVYSQSDLQLVVDQDPDFDMPGNWNMDNKYGIVHDIHSLGNMEIWRQHFLNLVGETEFLPWDPMFITEKTWKPILGLRPFVINGQSQVYKWLRQHGFCTFNHYWPQVEIESIPEYQVHDSIIAVIKYLTTLDQKEIISMYKDMLPDLKHNRDRFFEFAGEQKYRINHIFE